MSTEAGSPIDREALAAHITDMYASIGDRRRFDAHLDPDLTIWESDAAGLLRGLPALDTLRDRRATTKPPAPLQALGPESLLADVWGDTGLVRYILRARYADTTPDQCFRVTDVLRRTPSGWRIVHHHAEAIDPTLA